MKLKYFECDTNISKEWLKKIAGMFETMYQYNRAMDYYEKNKKDKEFEKYQKAFNDLLDLYRKEIQNPVKPARQIKEKLEVEKLKERRAYQEYLRKQKKARGVKSNSVFDEE